MNNNFNYTPLKISEKKQKFPLKFVIPTLVMVVLGTGVILGNMAISNNLSTDTKASGKNNREESLKKYGIKTSSTLIPSATPTPGYTNLFDTDSTSENPFTDQVNPFDYLQ